MYEDATYYEERAMGESARAAWVERARSIIGTVGGQRSEILDFGAGQGHLVDAFRTMGLIAEGVEPSLSGKEACQKLYGIALMDRPPASWSSRFDLITLVHSLEHSMNPVAALTDLRSLLRRDGLLFVEVPNAASVEMLSRKRRRAILDLPYHLFHFDPVTVGKVLARAGFHVRETRLSNSVFLEHALAMQARIRGSRRQDSEPTRLEDHRSTPSHSYPPRPYHRWWKGALLPSLRRLLPGWKLQVVASVA